MAELFHLRLIPNGSQQCRFPVKNIRVSHIILIHYWKTCFVFLLIFVVYFLFLSYIKIVFLLRNAYGPKYYYFDYFFVTFIRPSDNWKLLSHCPAFKILPSFRVNNIYHLNSIFYIPTYFLYYLVKID